MAEDVTQSFIVSWSNVVRVEIVPSISKYHRRKQTLRAKQKALSESELNNILKGGSLMSVS